MYISGKLEQNKTKGVSQKNSHLAIAEKFSGYLRQLQIRIMRGRNRKTEEDDLLMRNYVNCGNGRPKHRHKMLN